MKKQTNQPLLMNSALLTLYPTIPESDANFIQDYLDNHSYYDKLVSFQFGERVFEYDTDALFPGEWDDVCDAIVVMHLPEWARLYYALSLKYNPIWNVDGTEVQTYGETIRNDSMGIDKTTNVIGSTETTFDISQHKTTSQNGSRTNQNTTYDTAYPNTNRHESSHNEQNIGSGTDIFTADAYQDKTTSGGHTDTTTRDARTDSSTTLEHTDTLVRSGNIGVTMTQQLLDAEWKFRQKSFFDTIFKTILLESGLMYE